MSETYYDSTKAENLDILAREYYRYKNIYYNGGGVPITNLPFPPVAEYSVEEPNAIFNFTKLYRHTRLNSRYDYFTMGIKRSKIGVKINESAYRYAIVRALCYPMNTRDITTVKSDQRKDILTDCWIWLAYSTESGTPSHNFEIISNADTSVEHWTYDLYFSDSTIKSSTTDTETAGYGNTPNFTAQNSTAIYGYSRYAGLTDENYQSLLAFSTAMGTQNGYIGNAGGYSIAGFMTAASGLYSNEGDILGIEKLPDFIPVWDARDYDNTAWINQVVNWLHNGIKEGNVDPFTPEDPENPRKDIVEDYRSNFKMFLSPSNDSNVTHFSIACYNNDYNLGGEEMKDNYKMVVKKAYDLGAWEMLIESHVPYTPVYSFDYEFPKTDRQTSFRVYFANEDETELSTIFDVVLLRDSNSKVNCKVNVVYQTNNDYAPCSKSNIVDGARYTAFTGEYIDVVYRGIGINDLTDGYTDFPDNEDDKGGTDSDFFGASGLHTFTIDSTDLATINKKLWSTDWSTVFKSSTIDPIKCVIGCKAIPFTADNVSSAEVIIANLDTGLSKNYVKTVKSFNIGNCTLDPLYKDFTDISLTRVHCYLPFIGWVELPASEVMTRYEYASYGISARIKTLGFKYLVDFVDGSVKAIISVNGTERWLFDGNCAVDIPLTSDNHTQAVRNSIQSAIATTMSVGSIVAGAYGGNAGAVAGGVVGVINNAPDILPTYNYSASATGGGAIVQSLNNHIMIVLERPNVQKPSNYARAVGMPCNRVMNLSGLSGFTKCANVDVSGIDATPNELSIIKSLLESGVYL